MWISKKLVWCILWRSWGFMGVDIEACKDYHSLCSTKAKAIFCVLLFPLHAELNQCGSWSPVLRQVFVYHGTYGMISTISCTYCTWYGSAQIFRLHWPGQQQNVSWPRRVSAPLSLRPGKGVDCFLWIVAQSLPWVEWFKCHCISFMSESQTQWEIGRRTGPLSIVTCLLLQSVVWKKWVS